MSVVFYDDWLAELYLGAGIDCPDHLYERHVTVIFDAYPSETPDGDPLPYELTFEDARDERGARFPTLPADEDALLALATA